MRIGLLVNCPLLLSDFIPNRNMSTNYSKTCQYPISLQTVRSVVLELLSANRRTDTCAELMGPISVTFIC
jgi:hypothetical protein